MTNLIIETENLRSQKTNHILHLILSIITVGWWIPVWLIVTANNAIERGKTKRRIEAAISSGDER